nr:uncharacterized protein LOC112033290 [Quercus suber]
MVNEISSTYFINLFINKQIKPVQILKSQRERERYRQCRLYFDPKSAVSVCFRGILLIKNRQNLNWFPSTHSQHRISFSSPYWPLHHHTTTGPLPNSQARPPPVSSMVIGARDAHTIIKPYESMAVISSKKVASCLNYLKLCRPGRFYNIVSIARNRLPASMFKGINAGGHEFEPYLYSNFH